MIIYTHYNLDLDAASTAALAYFYFILKSKNENEEINFEFVGADITYEELKKNKNFEENNIIVDIDCEGHGLKGEVVEIGLKKYVKSAFSLYLNKINDPELKNIYLDLAEYIDSVDSGLNRKYFIKNNSLELNKIFTFFKSSEDNDEELLNTWIKFITGIYFDKVSYEDALIEADNIEWQNTNIAIIRGQHNPQLTGILRSRGAEFIIYKEKNNLGVIIDTEKVPTIIAEQLGTELPGWFIHPNGFLVCWGTKKAIKKEPPNVTVKELVALINGLYN